MRIFSMNAVLALTISKGRMYRFVIFVIHVFCIIQLFYLFDMYLHIVF